MIEAIESIGKEFSTPGWDGYDAEPVSPDSVRTAIDLAKALSSDQLPQLEDLGAIAWGEISIHWLGEGIDLWVTANREGDFHCSLFAFNSSSFKKALHADLSQKRLLVLLSRLLIPDSNRIDPLQVAELDAL